MSSARAPFLSYMCLYLFKCPSRPRRSSLDIPGISLNPSQTESAAIISRLNKANPQFIHHIACAECEPPLNPLTCRLISSARLLSSDASWEQLLGGISSCSTIKLARKVCQRKVTERENSLFQNSSSFLPSFVFRPHLTGTPVLPFTSILYLVGYLSLC